MAVPILIFDVNETLLDMSAMDPVAAHAWDIAGACCRPEHGVCQTARQGAEPVGSGA